MPTPPTLDTAGLHALVPLAATLGLRVASAGPDTVRVELDHRPELCTAGGILHGGALMALADTRARSAPSSTSPTARRRRRSSRRRTCSRPSAAASSPRRPTPLHVGSTLIVVETELRRDDGRLAAKTTQTQAVLRG